MRRRTHKHRPGLVGYRYPDGRVVCIDCDVYPPDTEDVRVGDVQAERCCHYCGTPLTEVVPLGE